MPQNKNAYYRYRIIDRCLQERTRAWSKKELMAAIDQELAELDPSHDGISERTLQNDLKYMRSIDGFDAPITYRLKNKIRYYHYKDPDFRINRSPLNEQEREALETMISIFDRFDGAPQFDWLHDTVTRIEEKLKLNRRTNRKIIAFDDNIDYSGREHIRLLARFIEQDRLLKIDYQPFQEEARSFLFHPCLLKEYNNRWFVFGWLEEQDGKETTKPWNLSLDRITAIKDHGASQHKKSIDWEDYFSDIIGVSRLDHPVTEIQVLVNANLLPYLQTKPLHGSQKAAQRQADGRYLIRYKLIPNYELEYQLLAFGEALEVLKPQSLREKLKWRIDQMQKAYQKE